MYVKIGRYEFRCVHKNKWTAVDQRLKQMITYIYIYIYIYIYMVRKQSIETFLKRFFSLISPFFEKNKTRYM